MSIKSRSNWSVKICLKKCKNRDKYCEQCRYFSEFEPIEKEKPTRKCTYCGFLGYLEEETICLKCGKGIMDKILIKKELK